MPWAYSEKADIADQYRSEPTGMERGRSQQEAELTIMTGMKGDFRKPTFFLIAMLVVLRSNMYVCVTQKLLAGCAWYQEESARQNVSERGGKRWVGDKLRWKFCINAIPSCAAVCDLDI